MNYCAASKAHNCALVIVQTRGHEDYLTGWLLEQERQAEDDEDRERRHILNLRANAEETLQEFPEICTLEPDWRKPGEVLCPELRPIEKRKKSTRENMKAGPVTGSKETMALSFQYYLILCYLEFASSNITVWE
jgi:hypothetical protein